MSKAILKYRFLKHLLGYLSMAPLRVTAKLAIDKTMDNPGVVFLLGLLFLSRRPVLYTFYYVMMGDILWSYDSTRYSKNNGS